jgi:magnesium transporter
MLRSLVAPKTIPEGDELTLRRNLTHESLEEALASDETVVWLDVVDPTDDEINWLEKCFKLHPMIVNDLRREDRRPSLLVYPDYLFLSLFQPQIRANAVQGQEIHCIVGGQYLLTVRTSNSNAVESAYDRAATNPEYWRRGVPYLLYLTTQFVVDAYYPLLDRVSTQLNKLEEKALSNGDRITQKSIFLIKQQLINLRQMVAPQREVLSNAIGEERLAKTNEDRDLFRHLYERLLRVYDVIDAQRDLASNVLDLVESQHSSQMANAVSRLTIFSMIFLPLTFLVGLFGLNFVTTSPEFAIPLSGETMFSIILILTVISAGMMAWFFRRRGWL